MAKVHLVDETAAVELIRATIKQAHKDLRYKGIKPQDKFTAKVFLEDLQYGEQRRTIEPTTSIHR